MCYKTADRRPRFQTEAYKAFIKPGTFKIGSASKVPLFNTVLF